MTDHAGVIDLAPSGHTPTPLGPVSPDRSQRLRELLEAGWRRHLTRLTAQANLAPPPGAPVLRNWRIRIHTVAAGDPVGCEGLVLHDRPGSVSLHLPARWTHLYDAGWAILSSYVLIDVAATDDHQRPTVALAGRWAVRDDATRGGWRAIFAPHWIELSYPAGPHSPPKVRSLTSSDPADRDVLAALPTAWPLAW